MVQLCEAKRCEFIAWGSIIRRISPDLILNRVSKERKALLPAVCHWFVRNHMFIAGTHPKQTQQHRADISISMGKENEEEKV